MNDFKLSRKETIANQIVSALVAYPLSGYRFSREQEENCKATILDCLEPLRIFIGGKEFE
jgi:hypothetical protein